MSTSPLAAWTSKASLLAYWFAGIEVEGRAVNVGVDVGTAKGLGTLGKGIEVRG